MENSIFAKKISNHPLFTDVERFVHIVNDNRREGNITLECVLQYVQNGNDITKSFANNSFFLIADNNRRKKVYQADGITPVMEDYEEQEVVDGTPQYNEDNTPKMTTKQRIKTIGLYDYFKALMDMPISTNSQYDTTIEMNDLAGKFNI